ncbi:hypothetical protein Cal6303_0436 [Calothrix sp. PCC 6303]|nr:hypothetical protein Cal6303_0436 [Calothrix sp. PCC 6303]
MQVETDKEFWMRQLEEWRKLVQNRESKKLQKLNSHDTDSINNDATNQSG